MRTSTRPGRCCWPWARWVFWLISPGRTSDGRSPADRRPRAAPTAPGQGQIRSTLMAAWIPATTPLRIDSGEDIALSLAYPFNELGEVRSADSYARQAP